ncbi:MAG: hypothetical protein ACPG4Y_08080, partial [Chitinophagales bacterium]
MKKITLLLLMVTVAFTGWSQQVIFEEDFQTYTSAGDPPPAGWVSLNEDGLPLNPFYTDQGIFNSGSWEFSNFGAPYSTGIFSCSNLDTTGLPVNNWLISPQ